MRKILLGSVISVLVICAVFIARDIYSPEKEIDQGNKSLSSHSDLATKSNPSFLGSSSDIREYKKPSGASNESLLKDVKKIAWDKQNMQIFKTILPNDGAVEALLKEINQDLAEAEASIGQYEITSLGNNDNLQLLVTMDVSGRAIYNTLYIVNKTGDDLHISEIWSPGVNISDLKSRIVDLDHDGIKEILIPRLLSSPQFQTDPRPIIDDIYEWAGNGFRKANASFKDYYRSLLQELQAKHEAIVRGAELEVPSQKDLLEKKYMMEIEEINRILSR